MEWKSWFPTLIKKLNFVIRAILIKTGFKRKRCQEGSRVLTEQQALEFYNTYNNIPLNMLELIGDWRYNCPHQLANPKRQGLLHYLIKGQKEIAISVKNHLKKDWK